MAAVLTAAQAQTPGAQNAAPRQPAAESPATTQGPVVTARDRRRAVKLYLSAAKLYQDGKFEQAWRQDVEAAKLDPENRDYALAAQVAQSHAVTDLLQQAARAREHGDAAAAHADIQHAAQIDPQNPDVAEHIRELADDAAAKEPSNTLLPAPQLASPAVLQPAPGFHSFHLRTNDRQMIQEVFHAYGIQASLDDTVRGNLVRLDLDNVRFAEAVRALGLVTNTFYVPIDEHRAVVARDTREARLRFERTAVETVPLSGLTPAEITEMGAMARTVFEPRQMAIDATSATLTLRAPVQTIEAFNSTYKDVMQGRSEVLLDVKLLQIVHNNARNTGAQLPQTITAFNVYAEEQQILSANQALVQQIISSGLAAPGDTLAILGILLASGQVSSSLFSNGIALFGGGLTQSALSPGGPAALNFNLNSSDSRELDDYRLRLLDGEEGTLKSGTRYPIQTSSYSNLGANSLNIPGLTGAGTSGSLSSILASLSGAAVNVPQVQYQDLGVVFKARPSILRSGEVAMNIDLKISSLQGTSINGVPVLSNRAYSGSVRVRAGESVVLAGEVDQSESRDISGVPGLSEIPGLNNITDKLNQLNYATLLILVTPRVVRMEHGSGHSPMVRLDSDLTK